MNANMKKWIEALRSGTYQQGVARLRRQGRYCCLGVACDLMDSSKWRTSGWRMDDGRISSFYLPTEVADWLGIDKEYRLDPEGLTTNVLVKNRHDQKDDIASMNDDGASFDDIADAIERTFGDELDE